MGSIQVPHRQLRLGSMHPTAQCLLFSASWLLRVLGPVPQIRTETGEAKVFSLETCHVIENVKLTHQKSAESGPWADPLPGLELGDRHPNRPPDPPQQKHMKQGGQERTKSLARCNWWEPWTGAGPERTPGKSWAIEEGLGDHGRIQGSRLLVDSFRAGA